jgi:hypothetical protein
MRTKFSSLRLAGLIITGLLFSVHFIEAQPGAGKNNCNCFNVMKLETDQQQKMQTARMSFQTDTRELKQAVAIQNRALIALDEQTENYSVQKSAFQTEIGKLRAQIVQRRAKMDSEIMAFLNEDQKKVYQENCSVGVCHPKNMALAEERIKNRNNVACMNQGQGMGKGQANQGMMRGQQRGQCPGMNQGNCPQTNCPGKNQNRQMGRMQQGADI